MTQILNSRSLDLSQFVRPGDAILWSQGTAEPLTLSEALVEQRAGLGNCSVFLGALYSHTVRPEYADHLSFCGYSGIGNNRRLIDGGVFDVIPAQYSQLPSLLADGLIKCDVVFLHLSAEGQNGKPSLGIANDYMIAAARRARVVIAEINDQMPWTYGSEDLSGLRIDAVVRTSRPVLDLPSPPVGDTERRIARHAAPFIPDSAVLELGLGAIPDAILAELRNHRDIGIHSGMLGDSFVDLVESGTVTNASKAIDRGVSVGGVLFGTQRLYRFAERNPALILRPASYTHSIRILTQLQRFIAINSAIEVDLTGQVNAEVANGKYLGAIGGQLDFVRGANASDGGRSIIALPSTTKNGSLSRIVVNLSRGVTTTPRSDADLIVTEWGVAQLRGQSLKERMRRMILIAHPDHREQLERDAYAQQ